MENLVKYEVQKYNVMMALYRGECNRFLRNISLRMINILINSTKQLNINLNSVVQYAKREFFYELLEISKILDMRTTIF